MPRFGQTLEARLQAVEDAQRQLARSTSQLPERLAGQRVKIQSRLAITVDDPNTATYPDVSTSPNTYWIKFVDSTFDDSDDGVQALTTNNRQATAPTVVRNLRTTYIPEGTLVWVFQYEERWWTAHTNATTIGVFYLDENLPQSGSAEATQCEWDGDSWEPGAGDPVTVYDTVGSGPANQTDKVICWLSEASGRWEIIEAPAQTAPLVPFYLNARLTKGGSASATVTTPSAGLTTLWVADGANVTVHDVVGRFGPSGAGTPGRRGIAAKVVVDADPANDVYLVFSLDPTRIFWGKATAKWTRVVGRNLSYVDVNICSDSIGTELAGPVTERVYLTSNCAATAGPVDPNVRTGDVIQFDYDDNDVAFSDDPQVYDDPIGTGKYLVLDEALTNLRGGWRRPTGPKGKFIVVTGPGDAYYDPSTLGATGGTSHHGHDPHEFTPSGTFTGSASGSASLTGGGSITGTGTASVTFAASGGGSTIDTELATTGLTVSDTGHTHTFSVIGDTFSDTVGANVYVTGVGGTSNGTGTTANNTTGITLVEPNSGYGHKHAVAKSSIAGAITGTVDLSVVAGGLSLSGDIDLTGISISGSLDMDEIYLTHSEEPHINPFYAYHFVERFE